MRKKKHFKISPRQALYDRFYAINYLEPGKNWEALQKEANDSDEDRCVRSSPGIGLFFFGPLSDGRRLTIFTFFCILRDEEEWDDWTDQAEEPTVCILCPVVSSSPAACCAHMKNAHAFDVRGTLKAMSAFFFFF
jgi:hypothetical protein